MPMYSMQEQVALLPLFVTFVVLLIVGTLWFHSYTGLRREKAYLALVASVVGGGLRVSTISKPSGTLSVRRKPKRTSCSNSSRPVRSSCSSPLSLSASGAVGSAKVRRPRNASRASRAFARGSARPMSLSALRWSCAPGRATIFLRCSRSSVVAGLLCRLSFPPHGIPSECAGAGARGSFARTRENHFHAGSRQTHAGGRRRTAPGVGRKRAPTRPPGAAHE